MLEQLGKQLISLIAMIISVIIEYHVVKIALKDFYKENIIKDDDENENMHPRTN